MKSNDEEVPNNAISTRIKLSPQAGVIFRKRIDPSKSSERRTYQINRSSKLTVKGMRVHFQMFRDDVPLYHAKLKGRRPSESIPICNGTETHYSGKEFAGYLLCGNDYTEFSLRTLNEFGQEILTMKCHNQKNAPRIIDCTFFIKDCLVPQHLQSKPPKLNDDGHWELDFHGRHVITSIKNTILIDPENGTEFICSRKTAKNTLEIDAAEVISPLSIFGLAIVLCTMH